MSIEIEGNDIVKVKQGSKIAQIVPNNWILASKPLYSGYLNGSAPAWLTELTDAAVLSYITTNVQGTLDVYANRLDSLDLGVQQNITSIQNTDLSLNAKIDTTASQLGDSIAGVSTVVGTKVTEAEARSYVSTMVGSNWQVGNELIAESYLDSRSQTIVNSEFATNLEYRGAISTINDPDTGVNATALKQSEAFTLAGISPSGTTFAAGGFLETLNATVGEDSATLQTLEGVSAGDYIWDGIEIPKVGMKKNVAGVISTYLGGALGTNGWVVDDSLDSTTAETWAAGASKLAIGPDDEITGWSYADSDTVDYSRFAIHAQNFYISDGLTGAKPFNIIAGTDNDPTRITFAGEVSFNNVIDQTLNQDIIDAESGAVTTANSYTDNEITIVTNSLPGAVNSLVSPAVTDVYPIGTIWRKEISAATSGTAVTQYVHWVSQGGGNWKFIGGTYINGSNITTGSMNANKIISNSITASQIAADTITATEIDTASITAAVVTADSISGKTITGNTINGSIISAGTVTTDEIRLNSDTYPAYPYFKSRIKLSDSGSGWTLHSLGFAPAEKSISSTPFRVKDASTTMQVINSNATTCIARIAKINSTILTIEFRSALSKHYATGGLPLTYPYSPALKTTVSLPSSPAAGTTYIATLYGIEFTISYTNADVNYWRVYIDSSKLHILADTAGAASTGFGWMFLWMYTSSTAHALYHVGETDFYIHNTNAISQ